MPLLTNDIRRGQAAHNIGWGTIKSRISSSFSGGWGETALTHRLVALTCSLDKRSRLELLSASIRGDKSSPKGSVFTTAHQGPASRNRCRWQLRRWYSRKAWARTLRRKRTEPPVPKTVVCSAYSAC